MSSRPEILLRQPDHRVCALYPYLYHTIIESTLFHRCVCMHIISECLEKKWNGVFLPLLTLWFIWPGWPVARHSLASWDCSNDPLASTFVRMCWSCWDQGSASLQLSVLHHWSPETSPSHSVSLPRRPCLHSSLFGLDLPFTLCSTAPS